VVLGMLAQRFLGVKIILTAGLKLNSITSPTSDVILFGEYCSKPFTPTITLVLRKPPTGRPSGGEELGLEAVRALAL
jgi:hypothetical protein